ncbi:MAG: flagellar biosynthesis protein FlgB [Archangiaceae bacterium]|nr:flagellar biosynthesis protein FlgB [Archangiaceae bacterium]
MKLFDKTLSTLERALDARLQRQGVLSGNLANVDTPHFKPKDVDVKGLVDGTETETSAVMEGAGASVGIDGNGVDVDRTLVTLAENALQYGATAKAAGKKLAILRYVASDGAA